MVTTWNEGRESKKKVQANRVTICSSLATAGGRTGGEKMTRDVAEKSIQNLARDCRTLRDHEDQESKKKKERCKATKDIDNPFNNLEGNPDPLQPLPQKRTVTRKIEPHQRTPHCQSQASHQILFHRSISFCSSCHQVFKQRPLSSK